MSGTPLIICAICNKPVDRFVVKNDYRMSREVWTVFCHGKSETTKLDMLEIKNYKNIGFDKAFQDEARQLETRIGGGI